MTWTGRLAGPTPRNARPAIPRSISRMPPANARKSSNSTALSARSSFAWRTPDPEPPPSPVPVESVPNTSSLLQLYVDRREATPPAGPYHAYPLWNVAAESFRDAPAPTGDLRDTGALWRG